MGSPANELERDDDESQHEATLTQGFYMQTTEVTQEQWETVMGNNPSENAGYGGDYPVENVSWNDVQAFITELNSMDEGTYRLPTEAEWECSARAGSTTAFANGYITEINTDYDPNLVAMGNYYIWLRGPVYTNIPNRIAHYAPNAWGLYDMHGNVEEWVQDWYDADYGLDPVEPVTDPTGPTSGTNRVFRGGSFFSSVQGCRSAARGYRGPDSGVSTVGFRLLRSYP